MATTPNREGHPMNYEEMSHEATELSLYIDNTEGFYRWTLQVNANMARKWTKGLYSKDLAIKAYRYVVDAAAKQYNLEHGTMTTKWSDLFVTRDRNQVAEQLADEFVSIVRQPAVWNDLGVAASDVLTKAAARS